MGRAFALRTFSRTAQLLGVLFAVALVTFLVQTAAPGDAAEARVGIAANLSEEERAVLIEAARVELGLDRSLPAQFVIWLGKAVRFDFGTSDSGEPVRSVVTARLGPTIELALASALLSIPLALFLALLSARYTGRSWTRILDAVLVGGLVVPSFWIGILLVLVFSVTLDWLPASGYTSLSTSPQDHLSRLALPAVTLALPQVTIYYRYVEEGLRTAMRSQYVRAARAKGLSTRAVLLRHALPNALLPALTIFGIYLGSLIGGVIVIEAVFGWPGIGSLLLYTVERSDYNTLVAVVLSTAVFYVLISTLVDMLYLYLDPRTRRA